MVSDLDIGDMCGCCSFLKIWNYVLSKQIAKHHQGFQLKQCSKLQENSLNEVWFTLYLWNDSQIVPFFWDSKMTFSCMKLLQAVHSVEDRKVTVKLASLCYDMT